MNMKRFFVSLCVLALGGSVRADVMYSTRYLKEGDVVGSLPESHVYLSPDAMLTEKWEKVAGSYVHKGTLLLLEEQKEIDIDYTRSFAVQFPLPSPGAPNALHPKETLTDFGEETIVGYKTHHYRLDTEFQGEFKSRLDIWLAFVEDLKDWPRPAPSILPTDTPLVAFRKQREVGLPVRTELWEPKSLKDRTLTPVYTSEISTLVQMKIDPSQFKLPEKINIIPLSFFQAR